MKKGRFLWSAHRITERQKAGKARSIKGKQLKNSRNTVSKQLVARLSSLRDNRPDKPIQKCSKSPEPCGFPGFFYSRNADFVSLILFGFERFWPHFSWLKMGQQAFLTPLWLKNGATGSRNRAVFERDFLPCDSQLLRSVIPGFSFGRFGRVCQGLTKPNTVYSVFYIRFFLWFKLQSIRTFVKMLPFLYNGGTKEACQMKKRKLKIYLTPTENRIVIQSLNNLRNAMLKENRDTGCIDELLLKVMCAPVKKV